MKILYSIPFIQIQNNTINANGLYDFLNEAKNSILKEYDNQNSPFTVQELKRIIRKQLDLSLDIVPLLKDIFDKYVLLPAGYWEYIRYANSNLEFNFFNIENSRIHIYTLSDMHE